MAEKQLNQVDDETVETGRKLFHTFLDDEIVNEGLDNPYNLNHTISQSLSAGDNFRGDDKLRTPQLCQLGRDLRELAEQFSRSRERAAVRQRAQEVDFQSITKEAFFAMMEDLFQGGISPERVVVLFFFCSDVAISALKCYKDSFNKLVTWALAFISETICRWVAAHGGWEKVLSRSFDIAFKTCVVIIGLSIVAGLAFYLVKKR